VCLDWLQEGGVKMNIMVMLRRWGEIVNRKALAKPQRKKKGKIHGEEGEN